MRNSFFFLFVLCSSYIYATALPQRDSGSFNIKIERKLTASAAEASFLNAEWPEPIETTGFDQYTQFKLSLSQFEATCSHNMKALSDKGARRHFPELAFISSVMNAATGIVPNRNRDENNYDVLTSNRSERLIEDNRHSGFAEKIHKHSLDVMKGAPLNINTETASVAKIDCTEKCAVCERERPVRQINESGKQPDHKLVSQIPTSRSFCTLSSNTTKSTIPHIAAGYYRIDLSKKLILTNANVNTLNSEWPGPKQVIGFDQYYRFENPIATFEIGHGYNVLSPSDEDFIVYFTELPIVDIATGNQIINRYRVAAQFHMSENNGNITTSILGIEFSGGSTQAYPKKSFRIELWKDLYGVKTKDIGLLGLHSDDDWYLHAMYQEPLRLRSKTSFDLWKKIDTLYYYDEMPNASNGVTLKYVELFLNGEYRGLYALSERTERKLLGLKKIENGKSQGELYKGTSWVLTAFDDIMDYDNSSELWGGFRVEYPDDVIDWSNLYEFVEFVMTSDENTFFAQYQQRFNIESAVNYFIFLNLVRATDNKGKNLFIAKYKSGDPYFYVPWDLDGTFGIIYNGDREENRYDILTNGFYRRMLEDHSANGFVAKVQSRWKELRKNIITNSYIINMFRENFNYLMSNAVYEREMLAWPENEFINMNDIAYISQWLNSRISFLDYAIGNMRPMSIDSPTRENSDGVMFTVYPNPATDMVHFKIDAQESLQRKITITNTLGQIVFQKEMSSNYPTDVSRLPNGLYFLSMQAGDGPVQMSKLLIKH